MVGAQTERRNLDGLRRGVVQAGGPKTADIRSETVGVEGKDVPKMLEGTECVGMGLTVVEKKEETVRQRPPLFAAPAVEGLRGEEGPIEARCFSSNS